VCAHVAEQILADLRPTRPGLVSIGVGHSAGALLTVYQQAAFGTHDAVALLGFAGDGLPEALTTEEMALAGQPERVRQEIVGMAQARFRSPRPRGTTGPSERLIAVPVTPEVISGIAASGSNLLAVVGLTSMIPGASKDELAAIDVPVFLGVGDRDITPAAPGSIPAQFPGSNDVTLYVLAGSGHNHNVAPGRRLLWDRMARWATSMIATVPAGAFRSFAAEDVQEEEEHVEGVKEDRRRQ